MEEIRAALKALDPSNDDHWTADGLPRLGALGIQGLSRQAVTAAAPRFSRENRDLTTSPDPEPEKTPDDEKSTEYGEATAQVGPEAVELPDANPPPEPKPAPPAPSKEELKVAVAQLEEAKRAMHDAERRLQEAQAEHDQVYARQLPSNPPKQNQKCIMNYLRFVSNQKPLPPEAELPIERSARLKYELRNK